jgi:hypothetical protein
VSFQAYIDNVKTKTGKTPEDFARLAAKKGLSKHGELLLWLKTDFALGHGHATAIAGVLVNAGAPKASPEQKLQALVSGTKEHWRKPIDKLIAQIMRFGPDVSVAVGGTYLSFLRAQKKFGILQPSSAERLDVGVKLRGANAYARFEIAGSWNAMVTHRVRVTDPKEIDAELLSWLKDAYKSVA